MAVQAIAKRHDIAPWRRRFQGVAAEGAIGGERVLLLMPGTYHEQVGPRGGGSGAFLQARPGDVVVFHDELELPPGKVRVKTGGGNAGHNGLRSISAHIGNDYERVRIGIGHPGDKELVQHYVLQDFAKERAALGGGAVRRHRRQRRAAGRGPGCDVPEQGASRHGRQRLRRRRGRADTE